MNDGETMTKKRTLGLDGLSRLTDQKAAKATEQEVLSMDEQEKAWIRSLITHLEQTIDWSKIKGDR